VVLLPGRRRQDPAPRSARRRQPQPAHPRRAERPAERPPKDPPKDPPKKPAPPPLAPEEQKRVDAAIAAGVAYLKKQQDATTGLWPATKGAQVGYNALLALALLECGVQPDDPSVKYAIDFVRTNAPALASNSNTATYEVSLAIMLLDKVGTAGDKKLIRSLALRLIQSQGLDGGWWYTTKPALSAKEEDSLYAALKATRPRSLRDLGLDAKGELTPPADFDKALAPLPAGLKWVAALQPADKINMASTGSDNSNTQFALIALWVAGRNDVPTERALALTARRFRTSQNADGGWGYQLNAGQASSNAMTGAGLLGLGVGHGLSVRLKPDELKKAPVDDAAIKKGMTALAGYIGTPLGPKANRPKNRDRASVIPYYFWTLERVGVMYSATKIGGKDWYQWGAELLVDNQGADGSWSVNYEPWSDTAFCLLFLKRANLVEDLSSKVEFVIDAK
jgi:hypothetical protein